MNSITIRKSKNPKRRTSYSLFFYSHRDGYIAPQLIGTYTTDNGSYVELGRTIDNWLTHNSIPADMETKNLKSENTGPQTNLELGGTD